MGLGGAIVETVAVLKIVLPVMFIGIMASNLLFSMPKLRRIGSAVDRLLPFKCGSVLIAFLAHPIAGLSTLSELVRRGSLRERELEDLYVLSLIPRNIRVVAMYLAPIAISSFGLTLGLTYTAIELFSRTAPVLLYTTIRGMNVNVRISENNAFSLRDCVSRSFTLFLRASVILIPSIFLVMLLLNLGLLRPVNCLLKYLGLPAPSLVVIAVGASSMIACIGVAGSMLERGIISPYWLLTSIFIASSVHAVVDFMRRSLTLNVSLFGAKRGLRLSLLSLTMRMASCAIAIAIVNVLWLHI